jgi:hypothetical protein
MNEYLGYTSRDRRKCAPRVNYLRKSRYKDCRGLIERNMRQSKMRQEYCNWVEWTRLG